MDESCISKPKSEISDWTAETQETSLRQKVQFAISDFGFEMQDSSNFKFPIRLIPRILSILTLMLCLGSPALLYSQARGNQPQRTGRAAAPIDLTGYWVSLVTNEWRWRMLTPQKGDYAVLPINDAARKAADAWDPAKDEASGNQCKGYGAAAILQIPGRLHITWENDTTLRMDIDAGSQTRRFHFGAVQPPNEEQGWQGFSTAQWQPARGQARERRDPALSASLGGTLKATTTRMRPGYLRKNGVPYSANAVVTEYFNRFSDAGVEYLNVTVIVEDPTYLTQPYVRSMQFRREPDGSKWNPTPCSAR